MNSPLPSYLSLRYESEEEQKYITGLVDQFEYAKMTKSYHLALFACHLLFMSFVYQTIFKTKKWMPERFKDALIQSPADSRKKHHESTSPWSFSVFPERSVFELLNLLRACEKEVSKCKKIIQYRNDGFGHATGILISEEEFEKKIEEYEQVALDIHRLTHDELDRIFYEYFDSIDPTLIQTKDDIEINLIGPSRLSDKDMECFAFECLTSPDLKKKQISKILEDDFGINVSIGLELK